MVLHLLQRAQTCRITTVLAICFKSNERSCGLFATLGFDQCVRARRELQFSCDPKNSLLQRPLLTFGDCRWGLLPECVVMVITACKCVNLYLAMVLSAALRMSMSMCTIAFNEIRLCLTAIARAPKWRASSFWVSKFNNKCRVCVSKTVEPHQQCQRASARVVSRIIYCRSRAARLWQEGEGETCVLISILLLILV